jgi:hypothetical protein
VFVLLLVGRIVVLDVSFGIAMFHGRISRRAATCGRTDRHGAVEAARVCGRATCRSVVAGADSGTFPTDAIFVLGFEVACIFAVSAFDSTVIHSHAG